MKTINKVEPRPKVRSEAGNSCFFQTGLKPMPKDVSRRELSKSGSRIEKGALCAELRPFYCSIRIVVPKFDPKPKHHAFFKNCLKPMPEDASRRELSKSVLRIEKGALCVELWPLYCSIRILVSMSYLFLVIRENMAKKLYMAHVGHGQ